MDVSQVFSIRRKIANSTVEYARVRPDSMRPRADLSTPFEIVAELTL
jgi:hypothetical protein